MKLALLGVALFAASLASAETPPPASPLRKAVLDALRPSVEARLGPDVEFVVARMDVRKGWAFVQAEPQRRGGKAIDGEAYFPDAWDYMDGLTTTAILRFQDGRWHLVESAIGATDVWYCDPAIVNMADFCN